MLLIGVGLDVATHVLAEPQTTELSNPQHSDEEINNISDLDLFDDDHLCQQFDNPTYSDQNSLKVKGSDQSIKSEYTDSSWQPPQFS
jgi:hypothetical protein